MAIQLSHEQHVAETCLAPVRNCLPAYGRSYADSACPTCSRANGSADYFTTTVISHWAGPSVRFASRGALHVYAQKMNVKQ